jgi:hypothetical protein
MGQRITRIVALGLAAACLALTATGCDPTPSAYRVTNNVATSCAGLTYQTPTDWYLPTGTPKGLVWLQHGFTEDKDVWGEYGTKLATAGYAAMATTLPTADIFGCTVENIGNNTAYLNNIASLFAGAGSTTSAIGKAWSDALGKAGKPSAPIPSKLAFVGHSAGGEAVTYIANRLRTNHASTFAKLKGLVLEDPVKSFIGDNMDASLAGLNTTLLPIYALASPPYSCNSNQSGSISVSTKLTTRTFHGSVITTGSHGDVFGASVPGTVTAACGTPQAKNTAATQTLTSAWLADEIAGTHTASAYPGGSTYQGLVTAGTISTLP